MNCNKRSTPEVCEMGVLERPRYFPRQLITPVEMTLEATYFRDKLRRHNRLLHGWGVVCGAEVCTATNADGSPQLWKVTVKPGYVLAPDGNEIAVNKERVLDLRVASAVGGPEDLSLELGDPWCRPALNENLPDPVYVAVRYSEIMTRQVRSQPVGCGCDDAPCEPSRICDGYEFGILTDCPASHQNPPPVNDIEDLKTVVLGPRWDCPDCPEDQWVVLAVVSLDGKGQIKGIDNCSCRRIVVSFAHLWGQCTGGVHIDGVSDKELVQGQTYDVITITGTNFQNGATVDMGAGVDIADVIVVGSDKITFKATVKPQAVAGPRTLVVTNPDCSMAIASDTILITEKPKVEYKAAPHPENAEPSPEETRRRRRR